MGRIHFAEQNRNIYWPSTIGPMKMAGTTQYGAAGMTRALDNQVVLTTAMATITGIFKPNEFLGYRSVWSVTDGNSNLIFGIPSPRVTIKNTDAADRDVVVTTTIPPFVTTDHVLKVYRTYVSASDPGDEMFLCWVGSPTIADLFAGQMSFQDFRPQELLGEPLYTNASVEGILQANATPPYCTDISRYRDYMFFSNVTGKQRAILSLVGTAGFVAGSTLVIGGVTYTAASYGGAYSTSPAGENTATGTFVFYTAGTSSEKIRGTAESICRVASRNPANSRYLMFYGSQVDETPGIMQIEERLYGDSPYAITSSADIGNNFEPKLPTSGTKIQTSNNQRPGWIFFSKAQQPEHVPLVNYYPVGNDNEPIRRILELRDCLCIIKDSSIWILTGTAPSNFNISLLDNTVTIGDRHDSFAVLEGKAYGLTNQGPVRISSAGVELIGRSEEFQITKGSIGGDGFSVGYGVDAQRLYLLSTFDPELKTEGVAYPYTTFAYNFVTNTWTRWLINSSCFAALKDRVYYGLNNTKGYVLRQRDIGDQFWDEEATVTVSTIVTATKTVTLSTFAAGVNYDGYFAQFGYPDGIGPGWVILDGPRRYIVDTYNSGTGLAVLNTVDGLTVGSKTCLRPIPWELELMPITGGNAGILKKIPHIVVIGSIDDSYKLKVQFITWRDTKEKFWYYSYLTPPNDVTVEVGDVNPVWEQKVTTRFRPLRVSVPRDKLESTLLGVRIKNNVAGARIALKCVSS